MKPPTDPPDRSVELHWVRLWNVLAYVLIAISLTVCWLDASLDWPMRLLAAGLAGIWGGWYWIFLVRYRRWRGSTLALGVSFVFAIEVATLLSFIHPSFLLLLFSFYGLSFSAMPVRWAVGLVILQTVSLVARFVTFSGGLSAESIPVVISFTVSAFFSVLLGIWIDSIIRQSRERQQMITELERTKTELAGAERQAGVLQERQRLAGEIHDILAQGFTSIVMYLEAAEQELEKDPLRAHEHLEKARQTARQSLAEARRFLWALQPGLIDRKPLVAAMDDAMRQWSSECGIPAELTVSGSPLLLAPAAEATLLRAVQEGLMNVRKHTHAEHVMVTLTYMEDEVTLDIQDNGQGFDPSSQAPRLEEGGFGLTAMRQRVEQLGGKLLVESAPGEGTTLAVSLPAGEVERLREG